jgi:mono/diheme cytochrome c family protein
MSTRTRTLTSPLLALVLAACGTPSDDRDVATRPPNPPTPPTTSERAAATPAISGGTLAQTPDGAVVIAADPDRNQVYIVDLAAGRVRHTVSAAEGEPGRVVADDSTAYVALRRGGAVLAIDLESGVSRRLDTCASPRGLALQGDALHVACAEGSLDTLDPATGERTRRVSLDADLRDVVVVGDQLYVSRFRAAELLRLDANGAVEARLKPAPTLDERSGDSLDAPTVAWRTLALPGGEIVMLHQRSSLREIHPHQESAYGVSEDACAQSIVSVALTVFGADGAPRTVAKFNHTLAVDVAPSANSSGFALATPGDALPEAQERVAELTWTAFDVGSDGVPCFRPGEFVGDVPSAPVPEVVAALLDTTGRFVFQSREPAVLIDKEGRVLVRLSETSVANPAHARFHRDAGRGLACASCHPEAGDDGHTWLFEGQGLRRTQFLAGGLKGTAPFHWAGDLSTFGVLMDEVHGRRMGGQPVPPEDQVALLDWIDAQPAPPAPTLDADRVERGRALFESSTTGCADCHTGALRTDNAAHDVGTGRALQTPMLRGLASRTRFMHSGCADELTDRFDADCGGRAHGQVEHLDAAALGDLVEYLRSL